MKIAIETFKIVSLSFLECPDVAEPDDELS